MGDRGNIAIRQRNGQTLWLYTHWYGHKIAELAQNGLNLSNGRWADEAYFNRCIITEFTKPAQGNDGFGVSLERGDNERPVIQLDPANKTVHIRSCRGWHDAWVGEVLGVFSFEEFLASPDPVQLVKDAIDG